MASRKSGADTGRTESVEREIESQEAIRNPAEFPSKFRKPVDSVDSRERSSGNENRRLERVGEPYLGFEGMFRAQTEGKIWLNSIDVVMGMVSEWMILELRKHAHEIAGTFDKIPIAWPSIVGDPPAANPDQRDRVRWARFLDIFSGRDHRFAILPDNLPGGALENRLTKFIDYDDEEIDSINYPWPLNSGESSEQPRLMKLLFLLEDERSHPLLRPVAESLMSYPEERGGDCPHPGTVVKIFNDALCETTELLLGLPDNMLRDATEPPFEFTELLLRVRMERIPEDGQKGVRMI